MTPEQERGAFERALHTDPYDLLTHRVFADWLDDHDLPELADLHRRWTPEWQQSKEWLEELGHDYGLEYGEVILMGEVLLADNWYSCGRNEDLCDHMRDEATQAAFWQHWCRVTGKQKPDEDAEPPYFSFSCAC